MVICFKGNKFKYEIEAIMKLFLPIVSFGFVFIDDGEAMPEAMLCDKEDKCICTREYKENDTRLLSINISLNGDNAVQTELVHNDNDDEMSLCRMLFNCLQKLTNITPAWGCLTGIRPVKKVNALLDNGYNKNEIFKLLKDKYYVSNEKLELAYQTALTQSVYLNSLEKNSYSLYISIPFCPSRCSYCSFVSHSIENDSAKKLLPQYIEKLCLELEFTSKLAYELGLKLDTIYIGGGTPTSLSADFIEILMQSVKKNFDISSVREYTVEAGRCDTITSDKLKSIINNGATRISINPQTMNDNVLQKIGRRHFAEDVITSFKLARSIGFGNINMDIIAGLPTDTLEGFRYTIDTLCELAPESITMHTLTVKRSSDLFSETNLRLDEDIAEMVSCGHKMLWQSGYLPYYLYRQKNTLESLENVGYAKRGYESLYNIYIMEEAQTILACGAGGGTKLVNPITNKIERVFNYKFPYEYISRFDKMMEKKNAISEFYLNI